MMQKPMLGRILQLPVKKITRGKNRGGYKWGKAGTKGKKLTKKQAAAVGRAAYANGYKGK
jgi:hypothetical protein